MKYFAALRRLAVIAIPVAAFVAIVFGGPKSLPPMASVNDPFDTVDFSDLPSLRRYAAEDGATLAYRYYDPIGATPRGSIVLIHGSSASSNSMHVLAKGFANAGYAAYALDIRGHGASGIKGKIKDIGQLEDDLDSFVSTVSPRKPMTLAGFSTGGGFVLRFAGSARQSHPELPASLSISKRKSAEFPAEQRGMGRHWNSAHHRSFDSESIRHPHFQ